jgi:uncharacterized protein YjgD (DUF1641 family)
MATTGDISVQEQVDQINRKLDTLLEYVEEQRRKTEAIDDLVTDVSIVARDAFNQSVQMLDKAQVEVDSCSISCLVIKVLQNLGTFHEMLEMMESAKDFMKDVSPVIRQVGLDAVEKFHELDQKGYFEYLSALGSFADKWVSTFTAADIRNLENRIEDVAHLIRDLTDPEMLKGFGKMTHALATVKMSDEKDDVSYLKILKQMRSKEVRKSLSYSLRLLAAINGQS